MPDVSPRLKSQIRVRMSSHDGHYAGGLVDGSLILRLFGDLATELSIRLDGDEGLFRAYEDIQFLGPVYAGDFVVARGEIIEIGRTSRKMRFEAFKEIAPDPSGGPTAARVLPERLLVTSAIGTTVTPLDRQRATNQHQAAEAGR